MIQLAPGVTAPTPTGMRLNYQPITLDELVAHLNFERQFCAPYPFRASGRRAVRAAHVEGGKTVGNPPQAI
jgi:hypothetical protein